MSGSRVFYHPMLLRPIYSLLRDPLKFRRQTFWRHWVTFQWKPRYPCLSLLLVTWQTTDRRNITTIAARCTARADWNTLRRHFSSLWVFNINCVCWLLCLSFKFCVILFGLWSALLATKWLFIWVVLCMRWQYGCDGVVDVHRYVAPVATRH